MSSTLATLLLTLFGLRRRANAYQPERHYMRGPGPKSREKLALAPAHALARS